MKHIYKENKYTFIIIIFIIIYLFRIFHLDIDVVNFNMAQVQPIDELYYNEIAIYLHHHGWKSLFTGELSEITTNDEDGKREFSFILTGEDVDTYTNLYNKIEILKKEY